jgi:alkanesulfonate monooxygenase SsuD/methylene tetrahydromethanopterin reductase-like flavin-dependent oxidoreductase (luciferase family)
MKKVRFGIIIAPDPEDNSRGNQYVQNIIKYLESFDDSYESVWLPDHFIPTVDPTRFNGITEQAYNNDYLECLTTTSYLLPLFPKMKFGQLVLCNRYRNPALLAKMTSTLQILSGGRIILGIGTGWYKEEYRQYGYGFPSPRERVRQLEEAVQIIKLMWGDDGVTFHGRHYRIEDAYCNPKPDPMPPIMIGGKGEKFTLKVVAEYADWWNGNFLDVETWKHKLNVLAGHCDYVGRDFDDVLKSTQWCISISNSEEEALNLAKRSQYYSERTFLTGTPESIVSQIGELVDAGVEYFMIYFPQYNSIKTTQLFADEVISELT